jgi:hypothetical protein
MAGQTLALLPDQSTAAQFRAWGSAISTAIGVQGLVQTADTGQINWTTVAAPSGTNTAMGYEIWRFNDSLQSSAPVFLKLEYGSGPNVRLPQMWVTVGVGSDGAGNLTGTNISGVYGAVTTRRPIGPAAFSTFLSTSGNVYVNGDAGCLSLLAWPTLITNQWGGFWLLVERWRNWDGSNSGDGVSVLTAGADATTPANSSQALCYLPNVALNPGTSASIASNMNVPSCGITQFSAVVGTNLYPLPILTGPGPRAGAPSQFAMAIGLGDYPSLGTFAMNNYGVSRTWICAGIGATLGWGGFGSGNIKSLIVRTS